jgi:hypothetical protein
LAASSPGGSGHGDDKKGCAATDDAFMVTAERCYQLHVHRCLRIGMTEASVLHFEQPDEQRLEDWIDDWLATLLLPGGGS